MSLACLQDLFVATLRDREGEDSALAEQLVEGHVPARLGIRIYRSAYWARQAEVLRDEYRRLAERLGTAAFLALAHRYLAARPSEEPRIECLGGGLPGFLRGDSDPILRGCADLAAFEWAEVEVLLAPESRRRGEIEVVPSTFAASRFVFLTALRLVTLASDPFTLPGAEAAPVHHVIWRQGFAVRSRSVAEDEALALRAALAGQPVAVICESLATGSEPEARAFAVIAGWLRAGWVAEIVTAPHGGGDST